MIEPVFWKDKRVLLTGHTGFKGSWLSLWLSSMGASVTGLALDAPTHPSLFEACRIADKMNSIIGDIRDKHLVEKVIFEYEPEIVIHMAAQPLVRYSYENPIETYETNVMGTAYLLEGIRKKAYKDQSIKAVVNVTTDKCYENNEWHWGYRENEPLGGYDPYSNSKACSELVTASYRNSFFNTANFQEHGVSLASARAGNVIGGGDWAKDRLIPDIIRSLSDNNEIIIRSPHSIRPWQHVLEPLSGYLLLAQKLYSDPEFAEAWNFGPNDEDAKPVEWIVKRMSEKWGDGRGYIIDSNTNPHEATYLKLDCSKAKNLLGWRPRWTLDQALDSIVDWSKAYYQGKDIYSKTLEQIQAYTSS
jgi:CDP-glucose 4,6-dehydratase